MTIRAALVPAVLTSDMLMAAMENSLRIMKRDGVSELMPDEPGPRPTEVITTAWNAMIAASPRAGRVGLDVLEMAAEALFDRYGTLHHGETWADVRASYRGQARLVLEAAGLAVEEAA